MNRNTTITTQALVSLGVVLLALGLLYFPILQNLAHDWNTNDNYSHGYFIPILSAYIIYTLKDELKKLPIHTSIGGLVLLIAGLAQLIVAKVGSEFFLQRTSLIPVLAGIVLFCLGFAFFKKLFLPIIYLIFMIPLPAIIWNKIAFPMQLFGSYLTEKIVVLMGIPIFREGNVLHLTNTTLEVVDACSGLRSLTTLFALPPFKNGFFSWQQLPLQSLQISSGYQQPHSWHQNMAEMLHRAFSMTSPALSFLQ